MTDNKKTDNKGADKGVYVGLWKSKSKPTKANPEGLVYIKGQTDTHFFSIFANERKKSASPPDYNMKITRKEANYKFVQASGASLGKKQVNPTVTEEQFLDLKEPATEEDDIPF